MRHAFAIARKRHLDASLHRPTCARAMFGGVLHANMHIDNYFGLIQVRYAQ